MRTISLFPTSARARLLLAFVILAAATMALAVVGWRGLSNTQSALRGFDERVLPDISRSLELAERTANLAALAPYVSEASVPFQLQVESNELRERIRNVLDLARGIPDLSSAAPRLPRLLERLDATLTDLIERTRQDLYLREDIRQHLFRLDQVRVDLGSHSGAPMEPLMDALLAAASADSREALDYFEQTYRWRMDEVTAGAARTRMIDALDGMGNGDEGLFALRGRQLDLQDRKAFLLAQTRALSEQLSGEVKTYVSRLQQRVNDQARSVGTAVRSGKTGIVLIAVICAMAAVLGVALVRQLVHSLKAVTHLMTRLAEGDTASATPATARRDELGALARAFHVFRENAVALKAQTRLLETVFNNINDGLSVFDRGGRLVAWNPQYLQILELPRERVRRGMRLEEVQALLAPVARDYRSPDGPPLEVTELNLRRRQQPQAFERHYGNGRVVEFRSRPMPDGGFVTLYSDLTDRKTVEAQLRQSQKMEVLGQLTGGVAHDFNNLLGAVIGNLQLLEDHASLTGRAPRYVERALAAAERGASLTRRLLAFARRQQLSPEPTEVDALVRAMVDLVEYSIGPDVTLELDLDSADAVADVDRGQLENALLNLSINASDAMPRGGRLIFRTREMDRPDLSGTPQRGVLIEVADTGCGIPESQLERVIEPFFTTKDSGRGSGLGLSIVYGFVKQSGGEVQLDSRVGGGTTVRLFLPALPPGTRPVSVADEARSGTADAGVPRRILLVEDDEQVRAAACDMLERLGHGVVAVDGLKGAREALALDVQGYDLVFSDVNLGEGGNGVALSREVAVDHPRLPVLLTSGLSRDLLAARFGLPAAVRVVPKPYRMEILAEAVRSATEGRKQ